jgi:hypothetical protein
MPIEVSKLGRLEPLPPTEAEMVQEKCALRYQEGDFPLLDVAKPIKVRIEPANNNAARLCGFDKDDGTGDRLPRRLHDRT